MAELFILALLGHLIGDYLFQTKEMALNKSKASWDGFYVCSWHVLIYTTAVCLMLWTPNIFVWLAVFIPHWIIDRFSFASVWLELIKGRTFESAYLSKDQHREFDVAFTALVYTVVDNTFHLLSLWLVIIFLL
ncbi:MAG: DUF3307 domain-containing protein [bacterium]|nr:DUF3307 domain-containing protein [bacterium]